MDLSILVPTLTRFGAPMLAELFETAATAAGGPLAGMAVTGISNFVLSKLGAAFNVPSDDPAAISHAVETAAQADPVATQAKLQEVQDDHSDLIKQAMAQAALDEQNVENARGTMLSLAQAKSPIAWGSPVISTVVVVAFAAVSIIVFTKYGVESAIGQLIAGALIAKFSTVVDYWLGSSKGSSDRMNDVTAMLHQAINSGVPTSNAAKRVTR